MRARPSWPVIPGADKTWGDRSRLSGTLFGKMAAHTVLPWIHRSSSISNAGFSVLNTAAALVAAGRVEGFAEGAELAAHTIDKGAARAKLDALRARRKMVAA